MSQTSQTNEQDYYCILTKAGSALEAAAHAAGKPVELKWLAVGDGNGQVPTPNGTETALVHEVYRKEIDGSRVDEEDPNICWIHAVIPATVGGFWIREFGIYAKNPDPDGEPVLYAIGNHAPFYKLNKILGQASTHQLEVPIVMSGTADVVISVRDQGYATQAALNATNETVAGLTELAHSHANKAGLDAFPEEVPEGFGAALYKKYHNDIGDGNRFVIYLSVDGSDANNGLSVEYPVKTFKQAMANACMYKGYPRIVILPGTYSINGISAPSLENGVQGTCAFNARFFASLAAYDPSNKPVLEGECLNIRGVYTALDNLVLHTSIKIAYTGCLYVSGCTIRPKATSPYMYACSVCSSSHLLMGNVTIMDESDTSLSSLMVTTFGAAEAFGPLAINRTKTGKSKYALTVEGHSGFSSYGAAAIITDASNKPLALKKGAFYYNLGQAAPAGSSIAEGAIIG